MLDERGRRRFAAAEARAAGFGGIQAVAQITGIARSTIGRGLAELCGATDVPPAGRVRRPGAGRKPLTETDPSLFDDLRALVEPATRGDPERPLLWTAKSLRNLAGGLQELGHRISLGASFLGLEGDEVIHCVLDVMYARAPYTVIQRAMHIHPTVSEFIPTMMDKLMPLQ